MSAHATRFERTRLPQALFCAIFLLAVLRPAADAAMPRQGRATDEPRVGHCSAAEPCRCPAKVPNVTHRTFDKAKNHLLEDFKRTALQFRPEEFLSPQVKLRYEYHDSVESGHVFSQNPWPDQTYIEVCKNTSKAITKPAVIWLTVSKGPVRCVEPQTVMENVLGLTVHDALKSRSKLSVFKDGVELSDPHPFAGEKIVSQWPRASEPLCANQAVAVHIESKLPSRPVVDEPAEPINAALAAGGGAAASLGVAQLVRSRRRRHAEQTARASASNLAASAKSAVALRIRIDPF